MKTYMHELIWGVENIPDGWHVAHKNGNGLDNRRKNLTLAEGPRPGPCEEYAVSEEHAGQAEKVRPSGSSIKS